MLGDFDVDQQRVAAHSRREAGLIGLEHRTLLEEGNRAFPIAGVVLRQTLLKDVKALKLLSGGIAQYFGLIVGLHKSGESRYQK